MLSSPKQYATFISKFPEVVSADVLARRFGFYRHPLWQAACADRAGRRKKMVLASYFLYALDVESQYASVAGVKAAREKAAAKKKAIQDKWRSFFYPPAKFSAESVEQAAVASHVQTHVEIGRLYSVTAEVAIPSLPEALKPANLQPSRQIGALATPSAGQAPLLADAENSQQLCLRSDAPRGEAAAQEDQQGRSTQDPRVFDCLVKCQRAVFSSRWSRRLYDCRCDGVASVLCESKSIPATGRV